MLESVEALSVKEAENEKYYFWIHEAERFNSIAPYANITDDVRMDYSEFLSHLKVTVGQGKKRILVHEKAAVVFGRNPEIRGPMSVFGYDYFEDHYDPGKEKPTIFTYSGRRGSGGEYAYEALNFVDGKKDVTEITNLLSAEFGNIPIEIVSEFLEALNSINVIFKAN